MTVPLSLVLDIAPDDVARFKKHPLIRGFSAGRPVTRRSRTIYYDTSDLALRQRRLSVQVDRAANDDGAPLLEGFADLAGQRDDSLDPGEVTDPQVREALA